MDRFDREYLDVLKRNADTAEENLKAAAPEEIDRLLNTFIEAKEDYVKLKKRLGM